MTYFYKLGNCVLASDQSVARYESLPNQEFRALIFHDDATVQVVESGDTYAPDNN